jgi:DNA (cytosine-5)-methyltransferase 1
VSAYYNEFDPFAAQWLRNLIAAGLIAPGDVDERSITEVHPDDVRGYTQAHFFAGIGGWSYALRLAGWPDAAAVWTGSCPCQPLSSAGQRRGHADERHLWPAFHDLIAECRPSTVFGEQVASADGREWLAGVRADLEALGYACGAADLCAAGVGAPHIRQRLFWVADAQQQRRETAHHHDCGGASEICNARPTDDVGTARAVGRLVHTPSARRQEQRREQGSGGAGHSGQPRSAMQDGDQQWNGATIAVERADGWARIAAEPALFPVAARLPGDVGRLRGSGNAIVPQVAAEFVAAFMECAP